MGEELADLTIRLGDVIKNHCNTHGCATCGLKYSGKIITSIADPASSECSATDLQGRIMDIELGDGNE